MTELEALQTIINRLDLIYTLLLYSVALGFGGLVLYVLYRFLTYFM